MRALPADGDPFAQGREQRFFFPNERRRLAQARQRDATGAREASALALDLFESAKSALKGLGKLVHNLVHS